MTSRTSTAKPSSAPGSDDATAAMDLAKASSTRRPRRFLPRRMLYMMAT
jgi:hypothetical protein